MLVTSFLHNLVFLQFLSLCTQTFVGTKIVPPVVDLFAPTLTDHILICLTIFYWFVTIITTTKETAASFLSWYYHNYHFQLLFSDSVFVKVTCVEGFQLGTLLKDKQAVKVKLFSWWKVYDNCTHSFLISWQAEGNSWHRSLWSCPPLPFSLLVAECVNVFEWLWMCAGMCVFRGSLLTKRRKKMGQKTQEEFIYYLNYIQHGGKNKTKKWIIFIGHSQQIFSGNLHSNHCLHPVIETDLIRSCLFTCASILVKLFPNYKKGCSF